MPIETQILHPNSFHKRQIGYKLKQQLMYLIHKLTILLD